MCEIRLHYILAFYNLENTRYSQELMISEASNKLLVLKNFLKTLDVSLYNTYHSLGSFCIVLCSMLNTKINLVSVTVTAQTMIDL